MTIQIGNASAPRWYDQSLTRLDEYMSKLVESGATSTELVLHSGESDEPIRRVHVLKDDWVAVFERYRASGLICHAHAPLHPRFKLDRWTTDPDGLEVEMRPILDAAAEFAERQSARTVLVLHGASGKDAEETTASFLSWATEELRQSGVVLSLELRTPGPGDFAAFDRDRLSLATLVDRTGNDRVGICWDIAHDWESREINPRWSPEPDEFFMNLVNHVHLHDVGGDENLSHYPLQSGRVPWQTMLLPLVASGYDGAITMEIRYRCALAMGEPWNVLGESYSILSSYLRRSPSAMLDSTSIATRF